MGISKETIEGKEVPPAGIYEVRLDSFKPKFSAPKEGKAPSLNLNAKMSIVNNPEQDGKLIYEGLNQNAGWVQIDFCHGFGLPMETDGDEYWLPGTWDTDPAFDPTKAETYKYSGPMIGRIAKVELYHDTFNGKVSAKVRKYFCAVDDCTTKFPEITHREDLSRKS